MKTKFSINWQVPDELAGGWWNHRWILSYTKDGKRFRRTVCVTSTANMLSLDNPQVQRELEKQMGLLIDDLISQPRSPAPAPSRS